MAKSATVTAKGAQPANKRKAAPTSKSKTSATVTKAKKIKASTVSPPSTVPPSTAVVSASCTTTTRPTTWDQLPNELLEKVMSHLHNTEEGCEDLANLLQVCRRFKGSVDTYMARPSNRPQLHSLALTKENPKDKVLMTVEVSFPVCDARFYDFSSIDCKKFREGKVATASFTTPLSKYLPIDKCRALFLSAARHATPHFRRVEINGMGCEKSIGLTLELLRTVTANDVLFYFDKYIYDEIGSKILEIVSNTRAKWCEVETGRAKLQNPNVFMTKLDSLCSEGVSLSETLAYEGGSCFGLNAAYWQAFLQAKLQRPGGRAFCDGEPLTSPVDLHAGCDMQHIEWS